MNLIKEARDSFRNYYLKSGIFHYHRDEFKQAVDFFQKALKNAAELSHAEKKSAIEYTAQSHLESGEKYEEKGELEAAIGEYEKAASALPGAPDIYYKIAMASSRLERWGDVQANLQKSLSLNKDFLDARTMLAFTSLKRGFVKEATTEFKKAYDLSTKKAKTHYQEGLKMLQSGNNEDAEEHFREFFLIRPKNFADYFKRGLWFLKTGRYQKASEEFMAALEIHADYPDVYNYLGITQFEMKRMDQAIESFQKSIKYNALYLPARINLSYALSANGLDREAERHLEFVLSKESDNSAALAKQEEIRKSAKAKLVRQ